MQSETSPTPLNNNSNTASQDSVRVDGEITAVLPSTMFHVKLLPEQDNPLAYKLARILVHCKQPFILAHISGKLRRNFIKLTIGDKVKLEMPLHGLKPGSIKGRIVYRMEKVRRESGPHKKPIRSYGPRRKKKSRSR